MVFGVRGLGIRVSGIGDLGLTSVLRGFRAWVSDSGRAVSSTIWCF